MRFSNTFCDDQKNCFFFQYYDLCSPLKSLRRNFIVVHQLLVISIISEVYCNHFFWTMHLFHGLFLLSQIETTSSYVCPACRVAQPIRHFSTSWLGNFLFRSRLSLSQLIYTDRRVFQFIFFSCSFPLLHTNTNQLNCHISRFLNVASSKYSVRHVDSVILKQKFTAFFVLNIISVWRKLRTSLHLG